MNIATAVRIIILGVPAETGNHRIAMRVAAERARVESFNRTMTDAGMPHRTAMWR